MRTLIIAAQSRNRVIGAGNRIPWRAKGEQKLFKDITMGGTLVMGRKTWESIGRPLPGRTSIVVSRQPGLKLEGAFVESTLEFAFAHAATLGKTCFVAGGGDLYLQTINTVDGVHLTTVDIDVEGDVLFPLLSADLKLVSEESFSTNLDFTHQYFERTRQTAN